MPKVVIKNLGLNSMHHTLFADGGETMVGSITTSKGGAWGPTRCLAVINAGGVDEGYQMTASLRRPIRSIHLHMTSS
jgi:hypothetical protein